MTDLRRCPHCAFSVDVTRLRGFAREQQLQLFGWHVEDCGRRAVP